MQDKSSHTTANNQRQLVHGRDSMPRSSCRPSQEHARREAHTHTNSAGGGRATEACPPTEGGRKGGRCQQQIWMQNRCRESDKPRPCGLV